MAPCSFARAGVAEPGCCPEISPSLGCGTAPPPFSHRRTLPFCPPQCCLWRAKAPFCRGFCCQGWDEGVEEQSWRESLRLDLSANSCWSLPSPATSWRGLAQSTVACYLNMTAQGFLSNCKANIKAGWSLVYSCSHFHWAFVSLRIERWQQFSIWWQFSAPVSKMPTVIKICIYFQG